MTDAMSHDPRALTFTDPDHVFILFDTEIEM